VSRDKVSRATVTMAGFEVTGTYHGGAYIDLSFDGGQTAFDVINVYDYATGKPLIANTALAVRKALIEYRREAGDSLVHDLNNFGESMR
jgi:hypothetical protein